MNFFKIRYSVFYILFVLAGHFISILGFPSIYDVFLPVVVLYHFLIVKSVVFYNLEKDAKYTKEEIKIWYLIITNVFNVLFFLFYLKNITLFFIVVISNYLLFTYLRPRKEKEQAIIEKNIREYFKTHKR